MLLSRPPVQCSQTLRSLFTYRHRSPSLSPRRLHTVLLTHRPHAPRSVTTHLTTVTLSSRPNSIFHLPLFLSRPLSSSAPNSGNSALSAQWNGWLAASQAFLPIPVPAIPSSLRPLSRVLRGVSELFVFSGCFVLAVLGVPRLLFFVQSDVILSQCVLVTVVALYASATFLLSRHYPLPPAQPGSARLSLPSGILVGLLLCIGLTVLLPVLGSSTREDPLILQLCFSAARQPFVLFDLAVLGPLREELLFRGLMFGRLCRLLSPVPAYAASSGVFGLLHSSPDSVKVVECVASGLVLALSYRLTLTLWAPIAIHVLNNTLVALLTTGLSPLCKSATVERSMRMACSVEDAIDTVVYNSRTAVGAAEDSDWHWRTGKREARVACSNLFTALDRGGKGYLDAEEVGFFWSLDDSVLDMLSAAFTVLHDDSSNSALEAQPSSSLSPQLPTTSLSLPSRSFFASLSDKQESAVTALYLALTAPPLVADDPTSSAAFQPAPSVLLTRLARSLESSSPSSSTSAADRQLLHARMCAYYGLFVRVVCEQRLGVEFASRLSREEFLSQCERGLVVRPARMKRMVKQATLIAMGAQKHPLAFAAPLETKLGKR